MFIVGFKTFQNNVFFVIFINDININFINIFDMISIKDI